MKIPVKDALTKEKNDSALISRLNENLNNKKQYSTPICKEEAPVVDCEEDVDDGPSTSEIREYVLNRRRSHEDLNNALMKDAIASRTAVAQDELDDNDIRVSRKYVETVLQPIKKELDYLKTAYDKKIREAWNNITSPLPQKDGYAIASTNDGNLGSDYSKSNYEFVNHPSHYNNTSIETIEKMRRIWGNEQTAVWCEMTAFKYRDRIGCKPDNSNNQEVGKIQWYENKAKELRSLEN